MKISNIHVGTIHRNVRISNWAVSYFHISFIFSYQFHIFISVSYSHLSMYGSYVDVWYFHISFIFSYQFQILTFRCMVPTWTFDIFISVWYFHISFIFSYQFAILMSQLHHFLMCGFATSQPRSDWNRQFPHASRWNWSHQTKTNVHVGTLSSYWFNVTMTLNSFTPTSATALRGRQR
jgi:hypothetical protein